VPTGGNSDSSSSALIVVTIAVGVLTAAATLVGAVIETNGNQTTASQPAAPPPSSNPPSSTPPTTDPTTPPATDPTSVGWQPNPLKLSLASGPIALSDDLHDQADIGYDFSSATLYPVNGAKILGNSDPSNSPPSVQECQYRQSSEEVYKEAFWDGYFCVETSRGDLVLVQPEALINGVGFKVWKH